LQLIYSKTPYRISLFGGGTDFPEWFENNKSLVITTSINKYATIGIRYLPSFFEKKNRIIWSKIELVNSINRIKHPAIKAILKKYDENNGIELYHYGDLPARSGIASSSAFVVGLLNLMNFINKKKISKFELSKQATLIEHKILKEDGGLQDQIITSVGGFKEISFYKKEIKYKEICVNEKKIKEINSSLLLLYTGGFRKSYLIQKEFKKNIKNLSRELCLINQIATEAKKIILSEKNYDEIGYLLNESWKIKKKFNKKISNSKIQDIYDIAIKSGATGGKMLGAGSKGFMILYCPTHRKNKILTNLKKLVHIPFLFENKGTHIINI
jgi:D-glycero-alpha-D-manno-heptose-7-phosphate kinase